MNAPYETPGASGQDPADRKPEELKQESEAIREDLELTLSSLERKVSPRELLDRSLDYMQENGGDLLQKIGATVSKNPLPLIVTSAGLIWLLASSRSSVSQRRGAQPSSAPRSGDFDRLAQTFKSNGGKAGAIKQRAQQTIDTARSRASETWDATREHAHEYSDRMRGFVSEQPLACGAIALAAGALLGAAFPASAYERDLVTRARGAAGRMLDDVEREGGEAGDEQPGSPSSLSH